MRFIPRENGIYLIDVKFNGTHIPGSPFKIRVGEPGHGGDPGLVSAYGTGLEGGVTGRFMGTALGVDAHPQQLEPCGSMKAVLGG